MPKKKSAKKPEKRRRAHQAKPLASREYQMPRTVADLGINCAICGAPGEWFDYERGRTDMRQGVLCSNCPRSTNNAKILVKDQSSAQTA